MSKVFWFDCETTGIDPTKCAILQLSGLIEIDGKVIETVDLYMRPLLGKEKPPYRGEPDTDDEIWDSALEINEWTREEIADLPHPEVAVDSLKKTLEKYIDKFDPADKFVCGGKNVKFDVEFLRECFRKTNNKYFGSYFFSVVKEVESLVAEMICEKGLRLKNYGLETLCNHFKVEIEAHEAMSDIIATRSLYNLLKKELGMGWAR